jgi:uncharacterized protein (AIM24 family)
VDSLVVKASSCKKIEGDGMAFCTFRRNLAKKELRAGEVLKVDTGCIVGIY